MTRNQLQINVEVNGLWMNQNWSRWLQCDINKGMSGMIRYNPCDDRANYATLRKHSRRHVCELARMIKCRRPRTIESSVSHIDSILPSARFPRVGLAQSLERELTDAMSLRCAARSRNIRRLWRICLSRRQLHYCVTAFKVTSKIWLSYSSPELETSASDWQRPCEMDGPTANWLDRARFELSYEFIENRFD